MRKESNRSRCALGRIACVAGLAGILSVAGALAPATAYAASDGTKSKLAQLTSEVTSATQTYSDASTRAAELQKQIDEVSSEILDIEQTSLPKQQKRASEAASAMYKMQNDSMGVLALLFSSDSFDDFMNNSVYLSKIQDKNNAELNRLQEVEKKLQSKMNDLNQAKNQVDQERQKSSTALAKAKAAQQQMEQQAASEDAQEQAAAEAAKQALAQAEAQHGGAPADTGAASAPQANTSAPSAGQSNNANNGGAGNTGSTGSQGGSQGGTGGSSSNASGWKSGIASYYGIGDGFMGGTTASGQKVTETSMGVAMLNVPLGTRVEIRYGGRSVIAVVNDRGPYAHGRVIDMQPAVARQLGFLSVGVGRVEYRFL